MVRKPPSWGKREGRRLRIADDLFNKLVGEVTHGIVDENPSPGQPVGILQRSNPTMRIFQPHLNICSRQTHTQHITYPPPLPIQHLTS